MIWCSTDKKGRVYLDPKTVAVMRRVARWAGR